MNSHPIPSANIYQQFALLFSTRQGRLSDCTAAALIVPLALVALGCPLWAGVDYPAVLGSSALVWTDGAGQVIGTGGRGGTPFIRISALGPMGTPADDYFRWISVSPKLTATVTGPGELRFWWRCDTSSIPGDANVLGSCSFSKDTTETGLAGGSAAVWNEFVAVLPAGQHSFKWTSYYSGHSYPPDPFYPLGLWVALSGPILDLDEVSWTPAVVSPFVQWAATSGLTGSSAFATADPDADGLNNLIEYAFGLNPSIPGSRQLPGPLLAGNSMAVAFTAPSGVAGITYGAEWSGTLELGDWTAVPDTGTAPAHNFAVPVVVGQSRYLRLKVTLASP